MLNTLATKLIRLTASIRPAINEPMFDTFGAAVLMLAALAWQLGRALLTHPEMLIIAPIATTVLIMVGAALFAIGAAGWLILILAVSFVRWRVSEETKMKKAWPAIVFALAGLIFLGIPELAEKLAWWQENVFRLLPHETDILKAFPIFLHSNRYSILGLITAAAAGCLIFWPVFRNFRDKLRDARALLRSVTTGRNWRVPAVLVVVIALTVTLVIYFPSDGAFAVLFIELGAVLIWFFAPVIRASFFYILVAVVWFLPALIANERIGAKGPLLYALLGLAWGAWLVSPALFRPLWWRIVYWAGALAFVLYTAFGPGSL